MYTWDNLISYIKLELGADINKLEFSDTRMMEIIREHSLMELSQILPQQEFVKMSNKNLVSRSIHRRYKIPTKSHVIDINEIFVDSSYVYQQTADTAPTELEALDLFQSNNYQFDLGRSLSSVTTFKLIAPNHVDILTNQANSDAINNGFILELNIKHTDVSTVPMDLYSDFRDLALGDIMTFLGRLRTKYQGLNTPYGVVNTRGDEMVQEGKELRRNALERLRYTPPRQAIYFLNDY